MKFPAISRAERAAYLELKNQGYTIFRNGDPDFWCKREVSGSPKEIFAAEVKSRKDRLRPAQKKLHELLRECGITVRILRPEGEAVRQAPSLMRGVYEKVKGSNDWYIRYIGADGRLHRQRVGRFRVACEALANKRRERREQQLRDRERVTTWPHSREALIEQIEAGKKKVKMRRKIIRKLASIDDGNTRQAAIKKIVDWLDYPDSKMEERILEFLERPLQRPPPGGAAW